MLQATPPVSAFFKKVSLHPTLSMQSHTTGLREMSDLSLAGAVIIFGRSLVVTFLVVEL